MSARFGTDGSRLLSLSAGGGALLWDVATRTHIAEMTTIEPLYFSEPLASFHPDGSRIALCGARDPIVIDATTGTIVLELKGHARQARSPRRAHGQGAQVIARPAEFSVDRESHYKVCAGWPQPCARSPGRARRADHALGARECTAAICG